MDSEGEIFSLLALLKPLQANKIPLAVLFRIGNRASSF